MIRGMFWRGPEGASVRSSTLYRAERWYPLESGKRGSWSIDAAEVLHWYSGRQRHPAARGAGSDSCWPANAAPAGALPHPGDIRPGEQHRAGRSFLPKLVQHGSDLLEQQLEQRARYQRLPRRRYPRFHVRPRRRPAGHFGGRGDHRPAGFCQPDQPQHQHFGRGGGVPDHEPHRRPPAHRLCRPAPPRHEPEHHGREERQRLLSPSRHRRLAGQRRPAGGLAVPGRQQRQLYEPAGRLRRRCHRTGHGDEGNEGQRDPARGGREPGPRAGARPLRERRRHRRVGRRGRHRGQRRPDRDPYQPARLGQRGRDQDLQLRGRRHRLRRYVHRQERARLRDRRDADRHADQDHHGRLFPVPLPGRFGLSDGEDAGHRLPQPR